MSEAQLQWDDGEPRRAVREAQWRLFCRNLPLVLLGNALCAVLVALAFRWELGGTGPLVWLAVVLAVNIWRFYHLKTSTVAALADPGRRAARWKMLGATAAAGLSWGVGVALLLPADSMELQALTAVFAVGLAAGSIAGAAPVLPAFLLFIVAMNGPLVVFFALHGGGPQLAIAAGCLLFTVLFALIGRNMNRRIAHAQEMRFANQRLLEELAAARDRAEQANRAKSEFLAGMSHELRTPLNAVLGFAQAIEQGLFGPLGDRRYSEYARDIRESGEHLLALINDVLDVSRIEAGRFKLDPDWCDLGEIARSSLRTLDVMATRRSVALKLEIAGELPWVYADARAVKQILLNLLSNAIKFTPAAGRVTLTLAATAAGGVQIRVSDTGQGIAPEDQARVLEPFVQAERKGGRDGGGVGLGLALSKHLAELHGGSLRLDSVVGEGTTVTVELPAGAVLEGSGGPEVAAAS